MSKINAKKQTFYHLSDFVDIHSLNNTNLIVPDTKYAKGSTFFIGHELHRVAKPLINTLPKITRYVQDCDGNKYVTIIKNK